MSNAAETAANPSPTDMMPYLVGRYQADRELLLRRYPLPYSPVRIERLRSFFSEWLANVDLLAFEQLSRSDQVDAVLLRNLLQCEARRLDAEVAQFAEAEPLLPFAPALIALDDAWRDMDDLAPQVAADALHAIALSAAEARANLGGAGVPSPKPPVALRAAKAVQTLRGGLEAWYAFYDGYDPELSWWVERPYQAALAAMDDYATALRSNAGATGPDDIVAEPIGRDAVVEELRHALVPYTPEELISIAQREMDWCTEQMRKAAREMGCGDDWRAALELVKADHVPPGRQPALIRDLAREAIRFVEELNLVTVPPLAAECWRMEMMSPERQKVNPFFLGGETILISFPTNEMDHPQKLMSLRGNNRAFARATVHHELIPGHWLQQFSQERHRPYRRLFQTPFWTEGWTLHWEMLLWELGFPQTPADRVGMLFWRMHRCARVIFSLRLHLGEMSPQQCVEMLVGDVGHERDNAAAEVRRSFAGSYHPLYQCAYLIGGMQMHALHRELTASGKMSDREFHDAVMLENCMPIELLRALLGGAPISRGMLPTWRFADQS